MKLFALLSSFNLSNTQDGVDKRNNSMEYLVSLILVSHIFFFLYIFKFSIVILKHLKHHSMLFFSSFELLNLRILHK